MSRRNKTWLSFPRAIAVAVVLCSFVLVKFQTPARKTFTTKKQAKRIVKKVKEASPESSLPVFVEKSLEDKISETLVPVVPKPEVVRTSNNTDCFQIFGTLGKTAEVAEVKEPLKIPKIKKTVKTAKRKQIKVIPQWINEELENPELNSQDALDNPSPLDEIAHQSFIEPSLSPVFDLNPLLAMVHWQAVKEASFPVEPERTLLVRESLFKKVEFTDLRETLKVFKEAESKDVVAIEAPQQKLAWSKLTEIPPVPKLEDIRKESSTLASNQNSLEKIVDSQNAVAVVQDEKREESKIEQPELQTVSEANQEPQSEESAKQGVASSLGPSLASVGGEISGNIENVVTPKKPSEVSSQTVPVVSVNSNGRLNSQSQKTKEETEDHSELGVLYGELLVDNPMLSWLEANKGHIELYLSREGSKDPQDTIFLMDYQFPASGKNFELESSGLKGKYRLTAGVYTPTSSVPVAQIPYSKTISSDTHKEKIRLAISKADLVLDSRQDVVSRSQATVPLTVTLFDGAPGNYRKPQVIKSGEVTLVGLPELGRFSPDKEGNIRIPRVPVGSEIVLEVSAPGYMPTRQPVPIFSNTTYAPIYLIQKDKVETVTQYFTRKPQQAEKSVLMGRVYDVQSRSPLAGESLTLSFRKGPAVYFGALPDLNQVATLETGLFGFYNIESSIRAVGRGEEKHSLLMDFEPSYGYFVEFGRGGERDLTGSLFDPFNQEKVQGTIQLVGDLNPPTITEPNGKFKIDKVDLPPGIVTLEATAEGYPRTWFTVPWSVRDSVKELSYYMVERDLIKESANRIARVRHEKNTGVIVGGAHTSLFSKTRKTLNVVLLDKNGRPVSSERGPYSLSQIPKSNAPYKLTERDPGFTFFNLNPGEYILKIVEDNGSLVRAHVVRVGVERVSVVVN